MAFCTTPTWGTKSTCPRITLTVFEKENTGNYVEYNWKLEYYASAGGVQTSKAKSYTAVINGQTVASGSFAIGGKTGTHLIAQSSSSNTVKIYRGTSVKTINYSCSMDFNLTWSGVYGGTKSASGSFTMQPKKGYTVTYNANGGSGAPPSQTVWGGESFIVSSTVPYKNGSVFRHWTDNTGKTYTPGSSYNIASDLTLLAAWSNESSSCTITYNANGGSNAPSSQTFPHGSNATISSATPTKSGSTFLGWSTEGGNNNYVVYEKGASFTIYNSMTLYAVWSGSNIVPQINSFTVERCNNQGTPVDNGTYALVKFNWSTYYRATSIVVKYNEKDSTISKNENITVNGDGFSGTISQKVGGALSIDKVYEFVITVTDNTGLSGSSSIKEIGGTVYTIDLLTGGQGLAFGKAATKEGIVDSALDIHAPKFSGGWKAGSDKRSVATKPTDYVNTMNFVGLKNQQDINLNTGSPYAYLIGLKGWYDSTGGNTHELAFHDKGIHHRTSIGDNNWNTWKQLAYKEDISNLYFKPGDSIDFSYYCSGFVTTGRTDVCFSVPVKPMIDVTSVTAESIQGFIIRQNNRYCYNSSGYTHPNSYTTRIEGHTVYITAKFYDDTGVTNNSPVGIVWSGRLKFY